MVSQKLKRRSVKIIATAACGGVYHATTAPSELGAVTIGLYTELLNRIRIRENVRDFGVRVFVNPPVQVECGFIGASAAGGDKGHARFRPRCALPKTSGAAGTDIGGQRHELEDVAAVQRQLTRHLRRNHRGQGLRAYVNQRRFSGHRHRLGLVSHFETHVDGGRLIHLQDDALLNVGLEASVFNAQRVCAYR